MYNTFIELIENIKNKPKEWREGQAWFNFTYIIFPEYADSIRGSLDDPFYNDENIPKFISNLCLKYDIKNWEPLVKNYYKEKIDSIEFEMAKIKDIQENGKISLIKENILYYKYVNLNNEKTLWEGFLKNN